MKTIEELYEEIRASDDLHMHHQSVYVRIKERRKAPGHTGTNKGGRMK